MGEAKARASSEAADSQGRSIQAGGKTLRCALDITVLDLNKGFPLFIQGMRENSFCFLAR
jgi:hypothetical protein